MGLLASALAIFALPLSAQGMHDLRAGVSRPERPSAGYAAAAAGSVSKRSLGIGAGVGALVGGIAGGVIVNNSNFGKNEAWPLFVGSGALIGALIGAGAGMAVAAFISP